MKVRTSKPVGCESVRGACDRKAVEVRAMQTGRRSVPPHLQVVWFVLLVGPVPPQLLAQSELNAGACSDAGAAAIKVEERWQQKTRTAGEARVSGAWGLGRGRGRGRAMASIEGPTARRESRTARRLDTSRMFQQALQVNPPPPAGPARLTEPLVWHDQLPNELMPLVDQSLVTESFEV
jgi:hypothetical protein